ncbi:hypothetical protein ACFLU6_10290 [Acidobacteriota bacterium]
MGSGRLECDDLQDYRPGMEAAKELDVRSPMVQAGLSKEDIRALSKHHDLPSWDKPQAACLSSRFPYGSPITPGKLKQIETGEEAIRALGFTRFRLRHHGTIARIEIAPEEFSFALSQTRLKRLVEVIKPLGFTYVTLDLEGYRTGSLNEPLKNDKKDLP